MPLHSRGSRFGPSSRLGGARRLPTNLTPSSPKSSECSGGPQSGLVRQSAILLASAPDAADEHDRVVAEILRRVSRRSLKLRAASGCWTRQSAARRPLLLTPNCRPPAPKSGGSAIRSVGSRDPLTSSLVVVLLCYMRSSTV